METVIRSSAFLVDWFRQTGTILTQEVIMTVYHVELKKMMKISIMVESHRPHLVILELNLIYPITLGHEMRSSNTGIVN